MNENYSSCGIAYEFIWIKYSYESHSQQLLWQNQIYNMQKLLKGALVQKVCWVDISSLSGFFFLSTDVSCFVWE